MSKKKLIVAGAVLLVAAGSVAAISATGPRHGGGWGGMHGGGHGGMQRGSGDGHDGMGRRGWFQREVTKEQHETRMRERFAGLDKNSDGFIDPAEIEGSMAERRGRMMDRMRGGGRGGQSGAPGDRMIERFDIDRDGKATKDEHLARARKRFAERDLNSDGKITDEDLPPMMRGANAIERMTGDRGGRGGRGGMGGSFGDVEVKDGAITLEAALAAAGRAFDRLDRNKDGVIDKADTDAMRKDMTEFAVKRFLHSNGATKDGKVSREQFFAKGNERFAEMDRNADGKIGRGEAGGRGMMGRGHRGMDGGPMGAPADGERQRGPRGGGDMPPRQ